MNGLVPIFEKARKTPPLLRRGFSQILHYSILLRKSALKISDGNFQGTLIFRCDFLRKLFCVLYPAEFADHIDFDLTGIFKFLLDLFGDSFGEE